METRAELDCLARLGVPLVQGYHLARPGPGWPQIDTETSSHLMTSEPLRTGTTLRSLLEPTVTVSDTDTADPLSWFIDDTVDLVVLIDRALRPVATITSTGPLRSLVHGILINLDTGVAQAAHRAITRSGDQRLEPLVCVDNAGRFVGIVRMERIVHTLASTTLIPSSSRAGETNGAGVELSLPGGCPTVGSSWRSELRRLAAASARVLSR